MPQNWKTYKLEELVTKLGDGIHGTPKYDEIGEYFFINGNNLENGKINIKPDTKRVSKSEYEKHKRELNESTLLVSINGTIGRVGEYDGENVMLGKSACYFNVKDTISKEFIKHVISSQYFINYIESNYTGSVIKNVSLKSMREFPINLPPLPEQRAIASILSALDDKIELNLQQNKTLEEMAMALYKHWFVDFGPFQDGEFVESELGMIPKGWEVKRLDEIAENRTSTFNFKKVKEVVFINTGDVQEGRFLHSKRSEANSLPGQAKKVIVPGDILYSEIRPKNKRFAYVNFDSSEYVVSTKFMIIKSIPEQVNNRLLYRILTTQDSVDYFNMIADGRSGTFPQITFTAISDFQIALPEVALQNEFQDLVQSFELMQDELYQENQTLTTLRDTLLPKLISGEVRVKDIEHLVKAAL